MNHELFLAIEMNDANRVRDIVESLRESLPDLDIDTLKMNDRTPLQWAIQARSSAAAMSLLELGSGPNTLNAAGLPPLFELLETTPGDEGITLSAKLVELGANVSLPFGKGKRTALHCAVNTNALKSMELFMRAGAHLDTPDSHGNTAMHDASFKGFDEAVRFLLSSGSDPNEKNHKGDTCLHRACISANYMTMEVLIRGGADLSIRSASNKTPLGASDPPVKRPQANRARMMLLAYGADMRDMPKRGLQEIEDMELPDALTMRQAAILVGASVRLKELMRSELPGQPCDEPAALVNFCQQRGLDDMRAIISSDIAMQAIEKTMNACLHRAQHGSVLP